MRKALRCATSLARFLRSRGRAPEARDLLAPRYAFSTEGFEIPIPREAKAVLDTLG
jgi:hypothetical protein